MEKITSELAAKVKAWLEGAEVKASIEATEKAADGETGTFEVVITTANLDRYQEVISLDGWELEHYRNNPVVLWGHDHFTLPIGVCTSLEVIEGKMVAKGKFSPHQHAQEIRALYDMGIVRATSVGFIEKEREGNLITKAELLEFSFVSVPANPYALALAVEKELNINDLVTKGIFTLKEAEAPAETNEKSKGAVADEVAAQDAWEMKWKNFSQVDDVIYSFWKVYFDKETPVENFKALLDETIDILEKVGAGEKDFELAGSIKEIIEAPAILARGKKGSELRELLKGTLSALEELETEPERAEEEPPAGETEDEKQYRTFSEKRKTLQDAATILGDVLAETRLAIEAKR